MFSVKIPSALAGATAVALLMGSAAVAQQQTTGQQGQPAQGTAAQQTQASAQAQQGEQMKQSLDQVGQLLQQADQSLQQQDGKNAEKALKQANDRVQKPSGGGDDQSMLDLQAQLQQALDAIKNNDMETAQAAVQDAQSSLQDAQQSQQAASQQGVSSMQATAQQGSPRQSDQQASMQQAGQMSQGSTIEGQMSQEALLQLRDQLDMARLDLQSAMDSVDQARRALDNAQPGMASAGSSTGQDMTVSSSRGSTLGDQAQQATGVAVVKADREIPRLNEEETQKLLGVGDRKIGEASEMVTVSVGDVEGRDVVSYDGERIGEIDKIVNNGGQAYAIIEHGGFLGIGKDKVAMPMERLGMRGDNVVLLGLTEKQMKALPDYNYDSGQEMSKDDSIQIGRYQ